MAVIITLDDIVSEVEKMFRGSSYVGTRETILSALNRVLSIIIPNDLDNTAFRSTYSFATKPNIFLYEIDSSKYATVGNYLSVNRSQIRLTQEEDEFNCYRNDSFFEGRRVADGNGTNRYENISLQRTQILRSKTTRDGELIPRIFIRAGELEVTDDGNGNLVGDVEDGSNSTIDYINGRFSVSFISNIPANVEITATYATYYLGRPVRALFQDGFLEFNPVPDRSYLCRLEVFRSHKTLLTEGQMLLPQEMFYYIVYWTAKILFRNLGNKEREADMTRQISESKGLLLNQLGRQDFKNRSVPNVYKGSENSLNNRWY